MRIHFRTTMDDLIAFNRFHAENSPMMRRNRMITTLMVPGFLALVGLVTLMSDSDLAREDPDGYAIVVTLCVMLGLAASLAWFFFARWWWMNMLERNVRKLYREGNNRAVLGWRELEIVGDRLLLSTEFIESSIDLRAIDKIVGNDDYTFVYIGSLQAYLIPMNAHPEQDYRQFVAELRAAWQDRDQPKLASRSGDVHIQPKPR